MKYCQVITWGNSRYPLKMDMANCYIYEKIKAFQHMYLSMQ
jgi:hypothetical protein